jgi:hypothetical protein
LAFNCRVFGHRGVTHLHVVLPKQFSSDSVSQLEQPPEFAQVISVSGVATSSAADAGTKTTLLRIEVADGQTVRYEINPPGRNAVAGNASPSLSGKDVFAFAPGWTVSLIDAAGLP